MFTEEFQLGVGDVGLVMDNSLEPHRPSVVVSEVQAGSQAARLEVQVNDYVIAIAGNIYFTTANSLLAALVSMYPRSVALTFVRFVTPSLSASSNDSTGNRGAGGGAAGWWPRLAVQGGKDAR